LQYCRPCTNTTTSDGSVGSVGSAGGEAAAGDDGPPDSLGHVGEDSHNDTRSDQDRHRNDYNKTHSTMLVSIMPSTKFSNSF
jgi:hypothetical protein